MRDINRIPEILNELAAIWQKYPDLRLGQLLLNVVGDPMLYYLEDKDLIDTLKGYYLVEKA